MGVKAAVKVIGTNIAIICVWIYLVEHQYIKDDFDPLVWALVAPQIILALYLQGRINRKSLSESRPSDPQL